MNVQAVATYIRVMMEEQGLKTLAITSAAGVHPNYLWRLESGESKRPYLDIIAALVRAVGGDMADIGDLLDKEDAPADYPELLAKARLKLSKMTPEERAAVQNRARNLIEG